MKRRHADKNKIFSWHVIEQVPLGSPVNLTGIVYTNHPEIVNCKQNYKRDDIETLMQINDF